MRIEISDVGKQFHTRSGEVITALQGVTSSIQSGEFVALLGPSGCGKSTLLDLVAGLQTTSSGSVLFNGVARTPYDPKPGMVFQAPVLLPWRTALENVLLPLETGAARRSGGKAVDRMARARDLLALVGLGGFEHKLPSELSGGMRQRVALARALIVDSGVLCMDEPFSALDEFTREQIHLELLKLWEEGRFTVLFVTHSVFEAAFLADRVLVMTPRPGKVVADVRLHLPRPRTREMIGSDAFAEDVRRLREAMKAYWLAEGDVNA